VGSYVLLYPPAGEIGEVLTSRSPEWQEAFTQATLHAEAAESEIGLLGPLWWELWQRLRLLQRNNVLHPDCTCADYLVLMVRGLLFSDSIVRAVSEDPQLAQQSIWALFEPAPPVQKALLGSERFWDVGNTWRVALVRLALDGVLDPKRLADTAAAAAHDTRMGRHHRAWYRKIPQLLAQPQLLPQPARHGPPPPGNRLSRTS